MRSAERTRVHFFCLSKRNEPKKKTPDDLPLASARGSLRFSPLPARVNSWAAPTQTCTRLFPETAAMLGIVNGIWAHESGYGVALPPWRSRAPQGKTGRSEDCLSHAMHGEFRSAGFGQGAQGSRSVVEAKLWGAVSSGYSSLGTQRRVTRVCAAAHIKKQACASAINPLR